MEPPATAFSLPADLATFATEFLQPSPSLLADRQFLMSYLSSLIPDVQCTSERSSLARSMKVVLSDPDVDWRYLVIESCSSKGFHTWLAKRFWLLHDTKGDMAGLVRFPSDKIVDEEAESFLKAADADSGFTKEKLLEAVRNQAHEG